MTRPTEKLIKVVKSLQKRRYPVILVLQYENASLTSRDVELVSQTCTLSRINYREDVLARPASGIILGAYLRGHFVEWLLEQARKTDGLIIEKVDELIASWPEPDRLAFFMDFLHIECNVFKDPTRRIPILILSHLASRYDLPTSSRGQGIVFDLSRYQ